MEFWLGIDAALRLGLAISSELGGARGGGETIIVQKDSASNLAVISSPIYFDYQQRSIPNTGSFSAMPRAGPSAQASSAASLSNLSFYVRIDPLEPNYQAQPIQHGTNSFWTPPTVKNGFTRRSGFLFHWIGGTMTVVDTNDHVGRSLNRIYSAATVFTQFPDTPHLLVVPFDAQRTHPYQNNGGWRPLVFVHPPRLGNTQRTYSAVSAIGDRQQIAAPGSRHWMPQLLPRFYDCQPGSSKIQAGLIGSIPILIALAAFSAPPNVLAGVLTTCIQPRAWRPHQFQYPGGHIPERGMVVTIFFDPLNAQGSNAALLNRLQDGAFGPFYA